MRKLPNTGTMVGQVGLYLLAQANNEMRLKELERTPCKSCGEFLVTHSMVNGKVWCPPDSGQMTEDVIFDAVK